MFLVAMLNDRERYDQIIFKNSPVTISVQGEVTDSFNLTQEDVIQLREAVQPNEQLIIDWMTDYINVTEKPKVRKWSISTGQGDITNTGTHWPTRRQGQKDPVKNLALKNMRDRAIDSAGIVQERVEVSDAPLEIHDIFVWFNNYVWTVNGLASMDQAVSKADAILQSPRVQEIIKNSKHGARLSQRLKLTSDTIARDIVGGPSFDGAVSDFMSVVVKNLTRTMLSINP